MLWLGPKQESLRGPCLDKAILMRDPRASGLGGGLGPIAAALDNDKANRIGLQSQTECLRAPHPLASAWRFHLVWLLSSCRKTMHTQMGTSERWAFIPFA